jgi:hypothetical protein
MTCEDVQRKLPAYEAGTLGPAEQAEVLLHARSCPSCREDARTLAVLWRALDALPSLEPSAAFRVRFWAKVREREARPRTGWASWPALFAGAMAAWLLGVAGGVLSSTALERRASPALARAVEVFTAPYPLGSLEAVYLRGPSGGSL